MGFEIKKCTTEKETAGSLRLILGVIGAHSPLAKRKLSHFFKIHASKPSTDTIILRSGGSILGTLQVVGKELKVFNSVVPVDGITNVCVDPRHQGKGLGAELMYFANRILDERSKAASILVARRAVDGFYARFGFLGTGCFTEMVIPSEEYNAAKNTGNITFRTGPAHKKAGEYKKLYDKTYNTIPFSFHRDREWWENMEMWYKFKVRHREFVNVIRGEKILGYFICQNGRIIEAACSDAGAFCNALLLFAKRKNMPELVITCAPGHSCNRYLQKINHTLKMRRAWDGGHMMRANDKAKFLDIVDLYLRQGFSSCSGIEGLSKAKDVLKRILDQKNMPGLLHNEVYPDVMNAGDMFGHGWSVVDEF